MSLFAGCLGIVGALLTGATPAAAAPVFEAWIKCDPVTNTITTGVTGPYGVPNLEVSVDFKVESGFSATATASAAIPATGTVTTVAARTSPTGDLTVNGYSRSWPIGSYLFYTEKVRVTVKTSSGVIGATRIATCSRDLRSTVTLTCDRDAHTITAKVEGTQFNEYAPYGLLIRYDRETRSGAAGGPIFTSYYPSWATHTVRPVSGAFSDVGWVRQMTTDPAYYQETVWATIILAGSGRTVGSGTATCVYSTPTTPDRLQR